MAVLPRVRRIEEILRQAQVDPREIAIICEIAERQRVQHQQMYEFGKLFVALQSYVEELERKLHIRDSNLEKLGVKEMFANFQKQQSGNLVESVEEFDVQGAAHNIDTGRKN